MNSKSASSNAAIVLLAASFTCCNLRPAFAQAAGVGGPPGSGGTSGDMGPIVTIVGNPTAPADVNGEIDTVDGDNIVVVRVGATVPVTVTATAQGTSAESNLPNKIVEVSLYGTKVGNDTIPNRPGVGDGALEAAHSAQNDVFTGVNNCKWVFKWTAPAVRTALEEYPATFSATWNLLFYYSPGWYWYVGEARDVWNNSAGYSFWSETMGAYHCILGGS